MRFINCRTVLGSLALSLALTLPLSAQQPDKPAPLPLNKVIQLPLVWPDKVTTSQGFAVGNVEVKPGTELRVQDIQRDGVVIYIPNSNELTMIPANWTDVGVRAAQTQQALPEDVRNLSMQDLIKRTDLLPDTVKLVTEVTMANNKVLPEGTELVAGRLTLAQNGQLTMMLAEKDAQFNQHGSVDRMGFNAEYTDVFKRIREKAAQPVEERKLRSSVNLEGKLVDAKGEPLPESSTRPQYYVVYYAANWCGWCSRFTPSLIKFHEEIQAKYPQVQIVYLSSDRTPEEMAENYKRHNMPWPAVAFDKRKDVIGLITMSGPSTPHLAVYTADGRLFHDGMPAGMNGANAALNALKRELSRTPTASAN